MKKPDHRAEALRLRCEVQQLEKVNYHLNVIRLAMYRSFVQEREELLARVSRIDLRIKALGLEKE